MPRKHDKKGKKRVVLSLAEFNEDAGLGGANPELASLPSAPKAPEQWEAEGGRPEYNSRGYKERQQGRDLRQARGEDGDDRDWSRRGPLDASESTFGSGADRDWSGMRGEGVDGDVQPERDWNDMRRGPVDSSFDRSVGGEDRDWSARKGPVEAQARSAGPRVDDEAWGSARRQPVDASFAASSADRDLSVRKPVEAAREARETDWDAPRKGPVESEFADVPPQERDWGVRKGPVDATPPRGGEADWNGARGRAPVEAEMPRQASGRELSRAPLEGEASAETEGRDVDWNARRGPVESKSAKAREVDFKDMRKGARLRERETESVGESPEGSRPAGRPATAERSSWRREGGGIAAMGRRGRGQVRGGFSRPVSGDGGGGRDWGSARAAQPGVESSGGNDGAAEGEGVAGDTETVVTDMAAVEGTDSGVDGTKGVRKEEVDDEWTKVRANPKRMPQQTRRAAGPAQGRDMGRWRGGRGAGRGAAQGPRPVRPEFGTEGKAHTSPVTPVPSATSES